MLTKIHVFLVKRDTCLITEKILVLFAMITAPSAPEPKSMIAKDVILDSILIKTLHAQASAQEASMEIAQMPLTQYAWDVLCHVKLVMVQVRLARVVKMEIIWI
jgi:hypothetical protein